MQKLVRKKEIKENKKIFNIFDKKKYKIIRVARIFLRKTYSNLFITLTDLDNKVIQCISSGRFVKGNKRRKTAVHVLEVMVSSLLTILKPYKISHIELIIKQNIYLYMNKLINELKLYGIYLYNYKLIIPIPHGFMKTKRKRRV